MQTHRQARGEREEGKPTDPVVASDLFPLLLVRLGLAAVLELGLLGCIALQRVFSLALSSSACHGWQENHDKKKKNHTKPQHAPRTVTLCCLGTFTAREASVAHGI